MNTTQFLFSAWSWNLAVLISAVTGLAIYVFVFGATRRIWWLLLALAAFLLTLVSPINALADGYLFSAHMVQHIALLLIVPGLLLLSLPRWVSLSWRSRLLAHPVVCWFAGVGAMWFWHWPALCNAAVTLRPIYALQTVSLLVLGALFWSQIMASREEERLSPPGAVLYLFSACVACSALGMILTFSPVRVCSIYAMPISDQLHMRETIRTGWGFSPEKDQQVGGLLMWVPMCLIYLSAILAQIARWFGQPMPSQPASQRV